jgi:hypothetical protein
MARAEAQVWAILADRLRAELHVPANRAATDATMRKVAAHELDPFAAADQLLAEFRLGPVPGTDAGAGVAASPKTPPRR